MRILILDDQKARHDRFAIRLQDQEVTHAYLFSEFTAALNGPPFDVVYLDHDLGDAINQERYPTMYGSRDYDGRDAAEAIAALPVESRPRTIVIHSWNAYGASAMHVILTRAGFTDVRVEPFK